MAFQDGAMFKSSSAAYATHGYHPGRNPPSRDIASLEGPVAPELLKQHPPVFSNSLKVYDDLIEDPFARG
jgi:hypothetical protein